MKCKIINYFKVASYFLTFNRKFFVDLKMAGCVPCFIIPLLLFIFHRFIQPIILKFWNPWENKEVKDGAKKEDCKFNCACAWNKNTSKPVEEKALEEELKTSQAIDDKVKGL